MKKMIMLTLLVAGSSNSWAMGGWYDFSEDKWSKELCSMLPIKKPSEFDVKIGHMFGSLIKKGVENMEKVLENPQENNLLALVTQLNTDIEKKGFAEAFSSYDEKAYLKIIEDMRENKPDHKENIERALKASMKSYVRTQEGKFDIEKDTEKERLLANEQRQWEAFMLDGMYYPQQYVEKNKLGIAYPAHFNEKGAKKERPEWDKEWYKMNASIKDEAYPVLLTTFACLGYLYQIKTDAKAMIEKSNK